jgi:ferredoxin
MCVGCGRCLRVCPTKIDWVNTNNLLKKDLETNKGENTKDAIYSKKA